MRPRLILAGQCAIALLLLAAIPVVAVAEAMFDGLVWVQGKLEVARDM
jgi:hypothetical protein